VRTQEPEYTEEEVHGDGPMGMPAAEELPLEEKDMSAKITEQRRKIKDFLDANSNDLLVTKDDYGRVCKAITSMPLEVWHFKEILIALENYHGPKV
jgi:hypothetical protein